MIEYLYLLVFSFVITYILTYFLIPRLKKAGIVGKDVNKPDKPEVAEMGGIGIVAGFTAGVLLAVLLQPTFGFDLIIVLGALITIHSIAFIGIVDDLLNIPQWVKAVLPLFAAAPLVALSGAGSTALTIPFIGAIDFGLIYIFVLIPIGIAVASNLTNMLAGFNGLEAGNGIVIFTTMAILAFNHGSMEMLVIFLPLLGGLLAFFIFNKFPAKVFPGDVGNLTIGAALAAGVIIGNFETAGAILLVPYVIDFFIKLSKRFPSSEWWGEWKDGKLYPVGKVKGFAQLVMKKANGITEKNLVAFFVFLEMILGLIVLFLYLRL